MRKTISVITPVYNEEDGLMECYETIKKLFAEKLPDYDLEHIFCDNASTDQDTVNQLRQLAAKDPNVKVILNRRNFGVLKNTYNGVLAATGDAVCLFMPADLQDPPELLPDMVKLWQQGYDVVYGIRHERMEPWLMCKARKIFYRLLSAVSYVDYPPDVGDYQLVDQKVIKAYRESDEKQPFLRMMPFEYGFKAVGIPYTWKVRKYGISRNRLSHLVDMALNGFVSFSNLPLRLALYTGSTIAALAILYAFGMIVWKLFHWDAVAPGQTILISGLFFFSGVQLIFLGIMGEYILAILSQVRKRSIVYEKERLNFDEGKNQKQEAA